MAYEWPIYYKDLIKTSNPESPVGIVTLWAICDNILKHIDSSLYQAAGQLYTRNGINFLVRNLLANKAIRYLIVCGQDRSESGKELVKLWDTNKSKYLHKEITAKAVRDLVANVRLVDLRGIEDTKTIQGKIKNLDHSLKPYGQREEFPLPEEKDVPLLAGRYPSEPSILKATGETVAETWLKALQLVLKFGEIKETDAMKMKEVLNLTAVITNENPDNFYLPSWLRINKNKIKEYLPQITGKEKIKGLHYTYGHRLRAHFNTNQVERICERLKQDRNAREAIGVLFDPRQDFTAEHRPCIVLIQALYNQNKLNLNAYVRSHDIFGGWPLNAFGLRKLHQEICSKTNLASGVLTIVSASAHIYDFNWEEATKLCQEKKHAKFEKDPRGYFKIETDKKSKKIIVNHYSPDDLFLKKYEETVDHTKAINNLMKRLDEDLAISLTIHAFYLGKELQKAEMALKLGIKYTQDQPLIINK